MLQLQQVSNNMIDTNIQQRMTFIGSGNGQPFCDAAFRGKDSVNLKLVFLHVFPVDSSNKALQNVDIGFRQKIQKTLSTILGQR